MRSRSKWVVLAMFMLMPLLGGASCSTNAVVQSGATTAVNVAITQLINTAFSSFAGG
jgi:hypothetical protein